MLSRKTWVLVGIFLSSIVLSNASHATVIIETGGGSFAGDSNVIFNACDAGTTSGPSATVSGCVNADHDFFVEFTGNEDLLADGGQALVLDAAGDGFDFLRISTASGEFATLIVNINGTDDGQNGSPNSGTVEINAFIDGVAQPTQTFSFSESGSNFFRISTDNGDAFSAIEFEVVDFLTTNIAFADFRQNRLGPGEAEDPPPPVTIVLPEPGAVGLFAIGLFGFGVLSRRRRKPQA